MARTTHLKISTPKGIFFDGDIDILTVKTAKGYIGIQRDRLPFISNIEISTMYINSKGSKDERICAISGGLIYVEREYVDIFTDDIAFKEDLNEDTIRKLIEKTEQKLKETTSSEAETLRNELLLKKTLNKMTTLNTK
ncbi:MAG: ATP synthase F1 subunit epsilon [Metamycoplasmataceae bacterium]